VLDLTASHSEAQTVALGPAVEPTLARRGEMLFNDARLCRQEWQSCASCHDTDGRMDAYNWDLLNDGCDNPKNAKSLLYAHRTPPAMSLGVRSTAEVAVRAGLRHILFTEQPEATAQAMDAYLQSLAPVPSPHLVNGSLSPAAERGRKLFMNDKLGCARCHPPPLYTDCRTHDVGTRGREDRPKDEFDAPTLVELWRTGPYLHDGAAPTVRDVHAAQGSAGRHGDTAHLSDQERDDLAEFLLSL
jgi:cytochrome c peroxidase